RIAVGERWRCKLACRPRRFLVLRSTVPPRCIPLQGRLRRPDLLPWFPAGQNLKLLTSLGDTPVASDNPYSGKQNSAQSRPATMIGSGPIKVNVDWRGTGARVPAPRLPGLLSSRRSSLHCGDGLRRPQKQPSTEPAPDPAPPAPGAAAPPPAQPAGTQAQN